jgi:hypothetical protein
LAGIYLITDGFAPKLNDFEEIGSNYIKSPSPRQGNDSELSGISQYSLRVLHKMGDKMDDVNRMLSRRDALKTGGPVMAAMLAGCASSGDNPTTTETQGPDEPKPTENTATEEPTAQPDRSFSEIYEEQIDEDEHGLMRKQVAEYKDRMENEDYETFSHLLEDLAVTLGDNASINPKTQELTRLWRRAVHNDLEISSDDIRIFGRDTAGGGTYTAIMYRNDDGDWEKNLTFGGLDEKDFLRHNETEDQIDFGNESEAGLWNLWVQGKTPFPATHYSAIKEGLGDPDKAKDSTIERGRRLKDRGNDHIIVGDVYDEAEVDYTVPGAERVGELMNWHENENFNEEMAIVEQATEAFHNSEEPYLRMEVQDGEVVAVPTEEHVGPSLIYDFYED